MASLKVIVVQNMNLTHVIRHAVNHGR